MGCTHHYYDDFALLKNIEGSQILYPASPVEFNQLFKQTYNNGLITYIRVPEGQHGYEIPADDVVMGQGVLVQEGHDVTIVAVGSQLSSVLKARVELAARGVSAEIIYIHTVKPLDNELVARSVAKTKRCLTIEEHGLYGGVADDVLRATQDISGVSYRSLNIGEQFIHEYGSYEYLCEQLGLSMDGVLEQTTLLLKVGNVHV